MVDLAIDCFEIMHPNDQALFLFDNSKSHGIMAEDALNAARMNVNPGGAQPKMRPGWYKDENGERVTQHMVFQKGDKLLFDFKLTVNVEGHPVEKVAFRAGEVVGEGRQQTWILYGEAKGIKQVSRWREGVRTYSQQS